MTTSTYLTLTSTPRIVRATEARLERIYAAAKLGLKGDSLALHAGLTPKEFRLLHDFDASVEMAVMQGRADSEALHAGKLSEASEQGDAKASLAILQHLHGWATKDTQAQHAALANGITINIMGVSNPRHISNSSADDHRSLIIDQPEVQPHAA